MMVPTQEKEHKKKCLLPDDGSFGNAAGAANPVPPLEPQRTARTLQARGGANVNGQLRLPAERLSSVNQRQTVQRNNVQQQQSVQRILPLDRFVEAASTRQARKFTGSVSRPRFVTHKQGIVQQHPNHRRIQGQFIANQ